jgi:hypothetical protein
MQKNVVPFSFEDAEEIAEDFEDLVDTEFKIELNGTQTLYLVEGVVISPFEEDDRESFVEEYFRVRDASIALKAYSGATFDVVVALCEADDDTVKSHLVIREFTEKQGIQYSFPS